MLATSSALWSAQMDSSTALTGCLIRSSLHERASSSDTALGKDISPLASGAPGSGLRCHLLEPELSAPDDCGALAAIIAEACGGVGAVEDNDPDDADLGALVDAEAEDVAASCNAEAAAAAGTSFDDAKEDGGAVPISTKGEACTTFAVVLEDAPPTDAYVHGTAASSRAAGAEEDGLSTTSANGCKATSFTDRAPELRCT